MNEWGGVAAALVAGLASAAVAWIGLRGEPAALRKLKAMNEALEKMSDSPSRDLFEEARDSVAREIAERTLQSKAAYAFFRWASWLMIAVTISAIAVYGVLTAAGVPGLEWLLIVGTVGAFLSSAATGGAVAVQWREIRKMEADLTEAEQRVSRLRTEAAPARTTGSGQSPE